MNISQTIEGKKKVTKKIGCLAVLTMFFILFLGIFTVGSVQNAKAEESVTVTTQIGLQKAVAKGGIIKVQGEITLDEDINISADEPVTIQGGTLKGACISVAEGASLTLSDIILDGNQSQVGAVKANGASVTMEGVTVKSYYGTNSLSIGIFNIINCVLSIRRSSFTENFEKNDKSNLLFYIWEGSTEIEETIFYKNGGSSLEFYADSEGEQNAVITDCNIQENGGDGIFLRGKSSLKLIRTDITDSCHTDVDGMNDATGIYIEPEATLIMDGGTIRGQQIGINSHGTLYLKNGTITGNEWWGIGGSDTGKLIMTGGTVTGNEGVSYSAEIIINDLEMSGGTVCGTDRDRCRDVECAKITLSGGDITGWVSANQVFTMTGGRITGIVDTSVNEGHPPVTETVSGGEIICDAKIFWSEPGFGITKSGSLVVADWKWDRIAPKVLIFSKAFKNTGYRQIDFINVAKDPIGNCGFIDESNTGPYAYKLAGAFEVAGKVYYGPLSEEKLVDPSSFGGSGNGSTNEGNIGNNGNSGNIGDGNCADKKSSIEKVGLKYDIPPQTGEQKGKVWVTGPVNKSVKSIKIPDKVTLSGKTYQVSSIRPSAFADCKNLMSVSIGKNVVKLEDRAFKGCSSLKKVAGCKNLKEIGDNAFNGCKKLKKVILSGKQLSVIGKKAFSNCKCLTTVSVSSAKLSRIGKSAFQGDSRLKTITFKTKKLNFVGKNAVKGIYKKAVIKVPSPKVKNYKKLFKASVGFRKGMKVAK